MTGTTDNNTPKKSQTAQAVLQFGNNYQTALIFIIPRIQLPPVKTRRVHETESSGEKIPNDNVAIYSMMIPTKQSIPNKI